MSERRINLIIIAILYTSMMFSIISLANKSETEEPIKKEQFLGHNYIIIPNDRIESIEDIDNNTVIKLKNIEYEVIEK